MSTKQHVSQVPFLIRVLWFIFLGWELTGIWLIVAWVLNLTILGLPFGLWMINRVPQVLTLKARPGFWSFDSSTGESHYQSLQQPPFLVRALYFVLIGWWFSLLWTIAAWLICLTIIGLPIGIMMLNAAPAVTTLQRG